MSAISDNLVHFLGRKFKDSPSKQFDVFASIIRNGLRTSQMQIKFGDGGYVFNQVVCFTDIPLSHCDEHTAVYGKFGIGFKKSYIKNLGGGPARYFVDYMPGQTLDERRFENRGLLYFHICRQFAALMKVKDLIEKDASFCFYDKNGQILFDNEALNEWLQVQILLLSFEKEMGDLGPARDETREMDLYYKEREWKLVPMNLNLTSGAIKNVGDGSFVYNFNRSDVNVVITPNEDMRSAVLKFFLGLSKDNDSRLREFSENLIPVVTYDDLNKW